MSALGVPEADILKMGGWETDHVMKSVYRHSMMEKAKREAAEQKSRKPLISLKKSWICGFHLTIGVTGFELGGFSPIITVNTAFHEILDKSLDKS